MPVLVDLENRLDRRVEALDVERLAIRSASVESVAITATSPRFFGTVRAIAAHAGRRGLLTEF